MEPHSKKFLQQIRMVTIPTGKIITLKVKVALVAIVQINCKK